MRYPEGAEIDTIVKNKQKIRIEDTNELKNKKEESNF